MRISCTGLPAFDVVSGVKVIAVTKITDDYSVHTVIINNAYNKSNAIEMQRSEVYEIEEWKQLVKRSWELFSLTKQTQ